MNLEEKEKKAQLYKNIFGSENGKKVLEDLEKHFFVNKSTLNFGPEGLIDPNRVLVNEGMRNVILYIKKKLEG